MPLGPAHFPTKLMGGHGNYPGQVVSNQGEWLDG